jgi:hypothetical protein
MRVLKAAHLVALAVADSQNQIAGAALVLHPLNRSVQRRVVLQDLAQHENKWNADAALGPK